MYSNHGGRIFHAATDAVATVMAWRIITLTVHWLIRTDGQQPTFDQCAIYVDGLYQPTQEKDSLDYTVNDSK